MHLVNIQDCPIKSVILEKKTLNNITKIIKKARLYLKLISWRS